MNKASIEDQSIKINRYSAPRSKAASVTISVGIRRLCTVLSLIALVWACVLAYLQFLAPDEPQPSVSPPFEHLQQIWQEYVKDIEPKP